MSAPEKHRWTITLEIAAETQERASEIAAAALLHAANGAVYCPTTDFARKIRGELLDQLRQHPSILGLGSGKTRIVREVLDELEASRG